MWITELSQLLLFCFYLFPTISAYDTLPKWRTNHQRHNLVQATTENSALVHNSANDISFEKTKLRHQPRFPHLDKVLNSLNHQERHKRVRFTPTVRTTTTTTEDPFEDYYGDDTDENEYADWEDDEEEAQRDDYGEEMPSSDDFFSDDNNDFQAEEATEPQVQRAASMSPISKYKWENYGTRPKVEENRQKMMQNLPQPELSRKDLIHAHYLKIKREGRCQQPQAKIVPVQEIHPDTSGAYYPHCTILHRCSQDTGCCSTSETKCGPKTQVPVNLLFYISTKGSSDMRIVTLPFMNHTECECMQNSSTPKTITSSSQNYASNSGLTLKASYIQPPQNIRHCKCPEEFTPKYRYNSKCSCDCEEDNEGCARMKQGKEHFGIMDRKCIIDEKCGVPVCAYGIYLAAEGRCQQQMEELNRKAFKH